MTPASPVPGRRWWCRRASDHDWWNAGDSVCTAHVTVTPPGRFEDMIGAVWGLAVQGRTTDYGAPKPLDGILLAEAFADDLVMLSPPPVVQKILARVAAPLIRATGRSVDQPRGDRGSAGRPGKLASQPVRRLIWNHRRREGGDRRRGVQRHRDGHGAAARRDRGLHDLRARRPTWAACGRPTTTPARLRRALATSTRTRTSSGATGRARARRGRRSWTTCTRRPTSTASRRRSAPSTEIASADFDAASGSWRLRTTAGEEHEAEALVVACGQLSRPKLAGDPRP